MQKIIPTILLKQLEQLDKEICFTNSGMTGSEEEMCQVLSTMPFQEYSLFNY
jgi:hypothetical protein